MTPEQFAFNGLVADVGAALGFADLHAACDVQRATDGTFFWPDAGTVAVDNSIAGTTTTTVTVDGNTYVRVDTSSGGIVSLGEWVHTAGGIGDGNWLLASGVWNDAGVWDDSATWND